MTIPAPGLAALLDGLIDYAGMFPPASLSLEEALANYLRDSQGADAWMLAAFVLPTGRMADAAEYLENALEQGDIVVSALGRSGAHWAAFFEGLAADISAVEAFRGRFPGRVRIPALETRLPGEELAYQIRADALVAEAAAVSEEAGLLPYFEVPFDAHWEERAGRAIASIRVSPAAARFKIRTGGVVPEAFPSPAQLAWGMLEAAAHGVGYKCTAGLHHPVRRYDPETGALMHGFVNVYAGAALAGVHALEVNQLAQILAEDDPAAFRFDDDGLAWRDLRATNSQIRRYRSGQAVSVGSCSFDEPRHDMQTLGWME